jgi:hypothetical protein
MLRTIAILLCGCGGLLASACAPPRETNTGSWRVEVHLYSGRPNPAYELTRAEAEQIEAMLGSATAVGDGGEPVLRSVLGYRGISLTRLDARGKPTHLVEAKGTRLSLRQGAARSALVTETPSLERHLLELALTKGAITRPMYEEAAGSQ